MDAIGIVMTYTVRELHDCLPEPLGIELDKASERLLFTGCHINGVSSAQRQIPSETVTFACRAETFSHTIAP
jgi:hypothetical protein